MRVEFEGTIHDFPDDFTDADIQYALGSLAPPPTRTPEVDADTMNIAAGAGMPMDAPFGASLGRGAVSGFLGTNKAVNDIIRYAGELGTKLKPEEQTVAIAPDAPDVVLPSPEFAEDMAATAKERSQYWEEKMKPYRATVQNFTDIKTPGEFVDWAGWNVGQMAGQMATVAPFMAMGGGELQAAKTGFDITKGLFTKNPEKWKEAGLWLANWAKLKPMDIPIGAMEAGQIAAGQLEEKAKKGTELSPIRGLAATFIATKLEELGLENVVNRFAKGIGREGNLFANMAKSAIGTGASEGAEEFFQTYAEQFGVNPDDLRTKKTFMEAVNGAAAGFIGGLAMGPLGGARGTAEAPGPGTDTRQTTTSNLTSADLRYMVENRGIFGLSDADVAAYQQKISEAAPEHTADLNDVRARHMAGIASREELIDTYSSKMDDLTGLLQEHEASRIEARRGKYNDQVPMDFGAEGTPLFGNAEAVSAFKTTPPIPLIEEMVNEPEYFRDKKGTEVSLTWMTPDEYLQKQAEAKNVPLEDDLRIVDTDLVSRYAEAMRGIKAGRIERKFPALWIEAHRGNQEGRHRALAAKEAGINQVPVYEIREIKTTQPSSPIEKTQPAPTSKAEAKGTVKEGEAEYGLTPESEPGKVSSMSKAPGKADIPAEKSPQAASRETTSSPRSPQINAIRVEKTLDTKSYADVKGLGDEDQITIYRAIPRGIEEALSAGDFVTPDKAVARFYARDIIGQRGDAADVVIKSHKVKAGDLRLHPDHQAIGVENEFIYNPIREKADITPKTSPEAGGGIEIPKESVVRDKDGNPIPVYHGSSSTFDKLTAEKSLGVDNLVGYGIYTTESPMVAAGYTIKGTGSEPSIRQVYLDIRKPLDFDAPVSRDFAEEFMDSAINEGWDIPPEEYDRIIAKASDNDGFDNMYRFLQEFGLYSEEQEFVMADESLTSVLEEGMFYDGITHIGGTEKNPHRVWVAFNDNQIIYPEKEIIPQEVYDKYPELLPNPFRPPEGGGRAQEEGAYHDNQALADQAVQELRKPEDVLSLRRSGLQHRVPGATGDLARGISEAAKGNEAPVEGVKKRHVTVGKLIGDLTRMGHVDLRMADASTFNNVYDALRIVRNANIEILHILYVGNTSNKILYNEAYSSRLPGRVEFGSAALLVNRAAVTAKKVAKNSGEQVRIILAHNHPSGNPSPSAADRGMTEKVSEILRRSGIQLDSHIVINHNKYVVVDTNGDFEYREMPTGEEKDPLLTMPIPHARLGEEVSHWDHVARVAQDIERGDKYFTILMRAGEKVRGIVNVELNLLGNVQEATEYIKNLMVQHGAQDSFAYLDTMDLNQLRAMEALIKNNTLRDAVCPWTSLAKDGVKPNPDVLFGKPSEAYVAEKMGEGAETLKPTGKGSVREVSAWHGGRELEGGKFSTKYIGTGEGQQAFGWGLYYSDLEDIGIDYAKRIDGPRKVTVGDIDLVYEWQTAPNELKEEMRQVYDAGEAIQHWKDQATKYKMDFSEEVGSQTRWLKTRSQLTLDRINNFLGGESEYPHTVKVLKYIIDNATPDNVTVTGNRNLYKVTLHKGKKPGEYAWLEWDKPLSEQSEKVMATLDNILPSIESKDFGNKGWVSTIKMITGNGSANNIVGTGATKAMAEKDVLKQIRGEDVYSHVVMEAVRDSLNGGRVFKSGVSREQAASLYLLSLGIDGIKYPSGTIVGRPTGAKDAFNYVVFDENAVTVEEHRVFAKEGKYGEGTELGDTKVPIGEWVFDWLGIAPGNVFADYGHLAKKHPEIFKNSQEAKAHVEYVMDKPEYRMLATYEGYDMLVRRNGKNKSIVIELKYKGGKYRVVTAIILSNEQMDNKIKALEKSGGRLSTAPGVPPYEYGRTARSAVLPSDSPPLTKADNKLTPPTEEVKGNLKQPEAPYGEDEGDASFDFGANVEKAIEEAPAEHISLDFKDHLAGYMGALESLVHQGEAGNSLTLQGAQGQEDVVYWGSTYPEFMKDQGWSQKEVLSALGHAEKGEKMTPRQREIVQAAMHQAVDMFYEDMDNWMPNLTPEQAAKMEASIQPAIDVMLNRYFRDAQERKVEAEKLARATKITRSQYAWAKEKEKIAAVAWQRGTQAMTPEIQRLQAEIDKTNAALEAQKEYVRKLFAQKKSDEDVRAEAERIKNTEIKKLQADMERLTARLEKAKAESIPKTKAKRLSRKGQIRIVTGQVLVNDLISVNEMDALKSQLLMEARAARDAFRAGEKTSLAKARAKYQVLMDMLRLKRRQQAELKKLINKMKEAQDNVDQMPPEYKAEIQKILEPWDLTRLTDKKRLELSAIRQEIVTNPDADFPPSVQEQLLRLDKRPIRDLSLADVRAIHMAVMHYATLGRNLVRGIQAQKKIMREMVRVTSIGGMKEGKEQAGDIDIAYDWRKSGKGMAQKAKTMLGIHSVSWEALVESVSGPRSMFYKATYRNIKEAIKERMRILYELEDKFLKLQEEFMERNGIKDIAKWLDETRTITYNEEGNKITMRRNQLLSLYRGWQDPDWQRSVTEGGFGFWMDPRGKEPNRVYKLGPEGMERVINSMTAQEREYADMAIDLIQETGDMIGKKFLDLNGYDMPRVESGVYWRKDVMASERGKKDEQSELEKSRFSRPGVFKGMTIQRTGSSAAVWLKPFTVAMREMNQRAADYVAMEEAISLAGWLMYDKQFRQEFDRRYGMPLWKEIEAGLKDVSDVYTPIKDTELEHWGRLLRNSTTVFALGLNYATMLKQFNGALNYLVYVPPQYLASAAVAYARAPMQVKKMHRQMSVEYRHRREEGFSQDVANVISGLSATGRRPSLFRRTMNLSMKPIQWVDIFGVDLGMHAAVQQGMEAIKAGELTPEMKDCWELSAAELKALPYADQLQAAYEWADYVTERTQAQSVPEHMSGWQRGGEFSKQFVMFMSEIQKNLSSMYRAYNKVQRGDQGAKMHLAKTIIFLFVLSSLIIDPAVNAFRDWARGRRIDKWWATMLKSLSSHTPLVRDVVQAIVDAAQGKHFGGGGGDTPIARVQEAIAKPINKVGKAWTGASPKERSDAAWATVDGMVNLAAMICGVPYPALKEPAKIYNREETKRKEGAKK